MRDAQSEISSIIGPDETLVWTGQPKRGIVFRTLDLFIFPISFLISLFGLFWVFISSQTSPAFALFGIPFILIALFLGVGRFIADAQIRKNSAYGLTDKRVIIKTGILQRNVKSINLDSLSNVEFTERADGSGNISFGPRNAYVYFGNALYNNRLAFNSYPQFEMIPNVQQVYNKIMELQRNANNQ